MMLSTAEDMAQYMFLHLHEGTWNGQTLLQKETIQRMHNRQFSQHPKVQGYGFGFFERLSHSHRFIEHGGDTLGTSSLLFLDKEM